MGSNIWGTGGLFEQRLAQRMELDNREAARDDQLAEADIDFRDKTGTANLMDAETERLSEVSPELAAGAPNVGLGNLTKARGTRNLFSSDGGLIGVQGSRAGSGPSLGLRSSSSNFVRSNNKRETSGFMGGLRDQNDRQIASFRRGGKVPCMKTGGVVPGHPGKIKMPEMGDAGVIGDVSQDTGEDNQLVATRGGEFMLNPETIEAFGGGDYEQGLRALNEIVMAATGQMPGPEMSEGIAGFANSGGVPWWNFWSEPEMATRTGAPQPQQVETVKPASNARVNPETGPARESVRTTGRKFSNEAMDYELKRGRQDRAFNTARDAQRTRTMADNATKTTKASGLGETAKNVGRKISSAYNSDVNKKPIRTAVKAMRGKATSLPGKVIGTGLRGAGYLGAAALAAEAGDAYGTAVYEDAVESGDDWIDVVGGTVNTALRNNPRLAALVGATGQYAPVSQAQEDAYNFEVARMDADPTINQRTRGVRTPAQAAAGNVGEVPAPPPPPPSWKSPQGMRLTDDLTGPPGPGQESIARFLSEQGQDASRFGENPVNAGNLREIPGAPDTQYAGRYGGQEVLVTEGEKGEPVFTGWRSPQEVAESRARSNAPPPAPPTIEESMRSRAAELTALGPRMTNPQRLELRGLQRDLLQRDSMMQAAAARAGASGGDSMDDIRSTLEGSFTIATQDEDGNFKNTVNQPAMEELIEFAGPTLAKVYGGIDNIPDEVWVEAADEWKNRQQITSNVVSEFGLRGPKNPYGPEGLNLSDIGPGRRLTWDDVGFFGRNNEGFSNIGPFTWANDKLNPLSDDVFVRDIEGVGVIDERDALRRANRVEIDRNR